MSTGYTHVKNEEQTTVLCRPQKESITIDEPVPASNSNSLQWAVKIKVGARSNQM